MDFSSLPSKRNITIVATIHTHGDSDGGKDYNFFSKKDIDGDNIHIKEYPEYDASYLCTPNGTLMKRSFDRKTQTWSLTVFKNKLPADEKDKTMKGYSVLEIKNSTRSIFVKTFDLKKYLETQAYLK